MIAFAAGYGIVWALVAGYVAWMGAQQVWLEERLQELEREHDQEQAEQEPPWQIAA